MSKSKLLFDLGYINGKNGWRLKNDSTFVVGATTTHFRFKLNDGSCTFSPILLRRVLFNTFLF